jgi:hypothetical protein
MDGAVNRTGAPWSKTGKGTPCVGNTLPFTKLFDVHAAVFVPLDSCEIQREGLLL